MDIEDFKNALERRLAQRLESESFQSLTAGGSQMRFSMSMAISGYPFELPEGANKEHYSSLLTTDQFMSGTYDSCIDAVFSDAYDKYM